MIATIGSILVWALIIMAGVFGAFCAVIGFMFIVNWPKGR